MTDDSLVLSWVAPEKDGGSKIIEYIVEVRETKTTKWTKVGVSAGNCTNIMVTKLVKDKSYEFRICARNEAGAGAWLETEDKIIAGRQISKRFISFYYYFFNLKLKIAITIFFRTSFLPEIFSIKKN